MAKVVNFPHKQTVINKEYPKSSFLKFHGHLYDEMNRLGERIDKIIDQYNLEQSADKLFSDLNPIQLGEIVVPIQNMFTRCDFLLRVYETQMKWVAKELELDNLDAECLAAHRRNEKLLFIMRGFYINSVGAEVIKAFRRVLLESDMPDAKERKLNSPKIHQLNMELINLGDILDEPNLKAPILKKLFGMLDGIGNFIEDKKATDAIKTKLKKAIKEEF